MRKALLVIALASAAAPLSAAVPVNGRWYTEEKDSIVHIGQCGAVICGKVAKVLKSPPGGGPAVDSKNPDPALRTRPIQGIVILSEFKDSGGEWEGKIYDPRAGKTYRSTMSKQPDGTLKVKGYVGPFSRSVTFTPAP
ncbi:DUF2147 domain-containing protein [Chakrabartia godavariana]|nr:DUF2147 domain-containing protein [Chakrabartia godavariana]